MKIYMDVCCYNRPFDDLSQDRIYLETEAILSIISHFDSLHLALAETSGADVFISTDDKLIRTANKIGVKIKAANPVTWVMEVTSYE